MILICCKLLDKLAFHSHKILFLGSVPYQIYMSKGMCFHSSHFVARDILLLGEVVLTLLSCSNTISICVFIVATHNNNDSRSKCGVVTMRNTSRAKGLLLSFHSLWTLRSKFSFHLRSQIKRTLCSAQEYVSCLYCNFCCIMVIKSSKEIFCSYLNRKF